MGEITFTLADFTFQGFATPEELDPLGGTQEAATHDFPGGIRSLQTYGAFPDMISWKGILTGSFAFDMAQAIDRIRVAAQLVPLAYERYFFNGLVTKFHAKPRHQWYVPYELHFMPIQDLSGASTPATAINVAEAEIAQQIAILTALYGGSSVNLLPLPAVLAAPVLNLINATNLGLTNANGIVQDLSLTDTAAITASIAALNVAATPLISSTDATQSSPALDSMMAANAIQTVIGNDEAPRWQLQTINPNLMLLSAQYYGDATLWRTIASANNLNDPQPIGSFNLVIPAPS